MAIDNKVYEPSVVVSSKQQKETMLWLPTLLVLLLGIVIGVALTVSLFKLDSNHSKPEVGTDIDQRLKQQRNYYEDKIAVLEAENALQFSTIQSMQLMAAKEEKKLFSLKSDLSFYKNLMNVETGKKGISLQTIRIEKIGGDQLNHRFRYKMVVQQKVLRHNLVLGKLRVDIVARQSGKEVIYPLNTIKRQINNGELAADTQQYLNLRFKYFQILEGEFVLPKSVIPELLVMNMAISKPKKLTIEEQLTWASAMFTSQ